MLVNNICGLVCCRNPNDYAVILLNNGYSTVAIPTPKIACTKLGSIPTNAAANPAENVPWLTTESIKIS